VIEGFSDEFIVGMTGEESRSRRLGDTGANAPGQWRWGGETYRVPHVLLLLYALPGRLEAWRARVQGEGFTEAFNLQGVLPTSDLGPLEPFGFVDGISQPAIDWDQGQSTDEHARDGFSNLLAVGELVLGYPNEYGHYTSRPLIDPRRDRGAAVLPDARERPGLKDFGCNGSYLVIRQLQQDVPGFWRFLDRETAGEPERRERLAARMVGRQRDGTPLVAGTGEEIPGIPAGQPRNHFSYDGDPDGLQCPLGAHIRRSNPRTGDFPPGVSGSWSRLLKRLGFGRSHSREDLVASTRFHRLLRRGRSYGPLLSPEQALEPDAPAAERGLQFICLVANISRQFEFVQNAWTMSSHFNGLREESDPLLGNREPLLHGESTDRFSRADGAGPVRLTCALPQFVRVRGGGYFFLPGLRALRYLAALPGGVEGRAP
jgi:Dyp-type peroxidase family